MLLFKQFRETRLTIPFRNVLRATAIEAHGVPADGHDEVNGATPGAGYDVEPFMFLRGPTERPAGTFIAPDTKAPVALVHLRAVIVGGTVARSADEVANADKTIKGEAWVLLRWLPRHEARYRVN